MATRGPAPGDNAADEAAVREAFSRMEALRQQLASMEAQRELVMDLLGDASRALATVEALGNAKDGDEVLIPVGAGAFVHARIATPEKALAPVGGSLHAEVPIDAAQARLKTRVEELESVASRITSDTRRVVTEIERLGAALGVPGA